MKRIFKKSEMLKRNNNIIFLILGIIIMINFRGYAQAKNNLTETVSINISFDSIQKILYVDFQNANSETISLPWIESLAYSDFEENIKFNVYVGNNREVQLLKITKNIPIYVLENNTIVLNKKDTITKKIELEYMISKNEILKYDYVYVQYICGDKVITSNRLSLR